MKNIDAKSVLKEVINDLEKYFYKKIKEEADFYSKSISAQNLLYLIFRKLTNQKTRDFIFNLLTKIFNKKNSSYFSSIEKQIFKNLKFFSLDFIGYCLDKNPKIPFNYFKADEQKEMKNFLKKMFYLSLADGIPEKLFSKEEKNWYKKKVKSMDLISLKRDYFQFAGFKSSVPFFVNLLKPDDYYVSIKKIDTVFDLGAFVGDTAFVFYKNFNPKKIYAFEPDPDNLKIMMENIKLNKLEDIVLPVELAVSNKKGYFYLEKAGGASAIVSKKSKMVVKVKTTTIDDFVEENKIKKVDFIKMDIEGAEFDALKGGVKTIKRDKPDLLIAVYHKGEHFFEIPGWLKKIVPQYHLRFIAMNAASPVIERYVAASTIR